VARLNQSGEQESLGHIDSTQGQFREQIDVVADELLQLAGNADVGPAVPLADVDPLNAPFVLYVNPYIGRDYFVPGSYTTTADDNSAEEELRRIEQQRLTCGYTEARPFRTINRAVIEAGIITSKNFFSAGTERFQLVSIMLSPGVHQAFNGRGIDVIDDTNFPLWEVPADEPGFEPTDVQLTRFNSEQGGIIIPRGTSLCSLDLRKCTVRPEFVPPAADEAEDLSNRSTMFRVTGEGYYFGITFRDSLNETASHHLLSCFEYGSQDQLDNFYAKIQQAVSGVPASNVDAATTRDVEWEIVGPRPILSDDTVDTTDSASPYIYNCSIRSELGLCGVLADGAQVGGFRSMVMAQFTGVSLQRDMSCWETWTAGTWTANPSYANYIAAGPDNTRMRPTRRSFHIRAINNAVIQEVSVFAIGQGVHHWVDNGGELTVTNSNSNFGGCAAIAEGYRGMNAVQADQNATAFPQDRNWNTSLIQVAADLSDETNNVRRIFLGQIQAGVANDATALTLTEALAGDTENQPDLLAGDNYSTRPGSFLWVENPGGDDYRATFADPGWLPATADVLRISAAMETEGGDGPDGSNELPDLAGRRVYVRRLRDTRSVDERTYALWMNNGSIESRTPLRDYVLQTTIGVNGITATIPLNRTVSVLASAPRPPVVGSARTAVITLTRENATEAFDAATYYRPGDRILRDEKHFMCMAEGVLGVFDRNQWQEHFVHTESDYQPDDFYKNTSPVIVLDNDTDGAEDSATLGYTFDGTAASSWFTDAALAAQLRSATDYRGLHSFFVSLGFTEENAHRILVPAALEDRFHEPTGAINGSGDPLNGIASEWNSWGLNFRRPSNIRLFGHAYEWAGYLNYSKALPEYQGELTPANKFTYYATNIDGGVVYFSGFNEEGFVVSPRGVEDIQTGEVLGQEQIGNVDREINQPTEFDALTVDELTVDQLRVNQIIGDITWGNAEFPVDDSWTRGGTDIPAANGPLPRLPDAQTPDAFPVTADAALQTRGITRYAREEEVDRIWTDATSGTPPATSGVATAAITPASLYSMVQDIVTALNGAGGQMAGRLAPTGMVGYFAASVAPAFNDNDGASTVEAWLPCRGQALNTFVYRRLHAVVSNTFGGDAFAAGTTDQPAATSTFNVPDLRGQFLRGWNNTDTEGPDQGRAFGTAQDDELGSHSHNYQAWFFQSTATAPGPGGAGNVTNTQTGAAGGDETRPVNVAMLPMIKT
jgi:microcystin-dependent protein